MVRYDNADRFDYAATLIVIHSDKTYTAQALAAQFNVPDENIRHAEQPAGDIDIVIILGRDYAQQTARD